MEGGTEMTKQELKMFIALQPKIKEAMGELRNGDKVYSVRGFGNGTVTFSKIDSGCQITRIEFETEGDVMCFGEDDFIRIPLAIDTVNPKRGLWGMLKGEKTLFDGVDYKFTLPARHAVLLKINVMSVYEEPTPTEAILKALCEQWEVTP
jgi:hypothetical protein